VIATFLDVAENVGYPIVFALIAIETMGIPVPGETALITAGIVASRGRLEIEVVIALAAAAAILGDNVGFAIGRKLGRRLLTAPGPLLHHRRRVIAIGEPFFDRHGPKAVFLGRWVSGLRITAAWMAGVTKMPWPTFLFWNALGGIAWAISIGLLAYFVGHSAETIIHFAGLGVDALGQRQRTAEGAESALDAHVALALVLVLGLALTGEGEDVVLDLQVDVGLGQARKIGLEHEVVLGLDEVHRGDPAAQRSTVAAVTRGRGVEEGVEQPVHLVLNRRQLTNRLPAHKCHLVPPDDGFLC
jgi:membrane-associated protein